MQSSKSVAFLMRKEHFGSKALSQILDKWNRGLVFKSIAEADPDLAALQASIKREKEDSAKLLRNYQKRRDRIKSIMASNSRVFYECTKSRSSHSKRLRNAQAVLDNVVKNAHLLSAKAFAFQKVLYANEPHHMADTFISDLKSASEELKLVNERDLFFFESSVIFPNENLKVIHIDVTKDARRESSVPALNRTISEAVDDKAERLVKPFVQSPQYKEVNEIYFHVNFAGI